MIDTRAVSSVAVHSGDYLDVLSLMDSEGGPVIIDDGDGACPLAINDHTVKRWELLQWLPTVRDVVVELDRDPQRYDAVTAARFRGVEKETR